MKQKYNRLQQLLATCLIGLASVGCGKVTQQATVDSEKPHFSCTFSVNNIVTPSENIQKNDRIPAALYPATAFFYDNPIYTSIHGYKGNKVKHLAWGKAAVTMTKKDVPINSSPNAKLKTIINYKTTNKDKKNRVLVGSPKKAQVNAAFEDKKKRWTLNSVRLDKTYQRYLLASYTSKAVYRLAVIDQETVSGNPTVNLGPITLHDTFKSLLFLESFRTLDSDTDWLTLIHTIITDDFFNSLQFSFPVLNTESFNLKSPRFLIQNPLIDTCLIILELCAMDVSDAVTYINADLNQLFTPQQRKLLLSSLSEIPPPAETQ